MPYNQQQNQPSAIQTSIRPAPQQVVNFGKPDIIPNRGPMQAQQPMRPGNNMAFNQDNRMGISDSGLTNNRVPVNPRAGIVSQNIQGTGNQIIRVEDDSDEEDRMNGRKMALPAPSGGGRNAAMPIQQQPNRNQNVNMMMMQSKK